MNLNMSLYPYLFCLILTTCVFVEISAANLKMWNKLARKQGPNVCPEEHVPSDSRFFSPPWTTGRLCGLETIVKFSCCHGFERVPGERGCSLVKPLKNIAETLRDVGASEFYHYVETFGLLPLLSNRGAFTVFAPRDAAFHNLSKEHAKALNGSRHSRSRPPLLLFTVTESRRSAAELPEFLDTLYRDGSLIVTKFPNGLTTINCMPLVATDIQATNGFIHVTESLLLPHGRSSIADLLGRSGSLSTTSAAVLKAQLSGPLRERGPMTLLAPVDHAWEVLPQHFMEALMDDPLLLKALLQYHLLDSVWCASVSCGESKVDTVAGNTVRFWCNESDYYVNEARIIEKDVITGNGFVHYIDKVLIPDKVLSLAELLELRGLTYFLQIAEFAGLQSLLHRPGVYSVFAPRNEAFEALPNSTLSALQTDAAFARSTISFHIASGRQLTTNFIDGQNIPTILTQSHTLRFKQNRKSRSVETSVIIKPDEKSRNGILHILDKVLLVPTLTVTEVLEEGNYSVFISVLNATSPNLWQILSNASNTYTVFAPDDRAMGTLPPGMLIRLFADPPLLYQMAARHIVPKFQPESGLEPGLTYKYPTVNGMNITLRKEDNGYVTVAALATIVNSDMIATNGIVHQVSRFIDRTIGTKTK